jgi:hypothetical protein
MSRFDNSTPAAQAARNAHNARINNTKPAPQRMPVPNPATKPVKLPAMRANPINGRKG